MQPRNIDFMFAGSQSAIKRQTGEPVTQVSLLNATSQHTLKVHDKVKRQRIHIFRIDYNCGQRFFFRFPY